MNPRSFGSVVASVLLSAMVLQAQITAVGGEFQVNSYTEYEQEVPSVAVSLNGSFVVTWSSGYLFTATGYDVLGQRYSSSGTPAGSEFVVNSYTSGLERFPAVGVDANGSFVVVWESNYDHDGESEGVFAQRYASDGTPAGGEFAVNSYTTGSQLLPAVGMHRSGSFVVVWESTQDGNITGIFAQRFAADGTGIGTEFQVNTFTNAVQGDASIGMDNLGAFVVAWHDDALDGSGYGVFAQRFSSNGTPAGTEFRANTFVTGAQKSPSVGMSDKGSFAIAWQSNGQDGDGDGVFVQRYSSTGAAAGTEFRANTITVGDQSRPSVGPGVAGGFVVSWDSANQDGYQSGVFARHFSSTGAPIGTEFQINTYTTYSQRNPSVGANRNGNFTVAWTSSFQDGMDAGVFAQRFGEPTPTPRREEFQVNSYTTSCQSESDVEVAGDGSFVIAWTGVGDNYREVFAQRFGADALPLGSEFQVNTYTTYNQQGSSVAVDSQGRFTIVWQSQTQDGTGYGIFGRRFDAFGSPLGMEFRVNSYTNSAEEEPAIAANSDGDLLVAWQSSHDGSNRGVFAQRFDSTGMAAGTEFQVNAYTTNQQWGPSATLADDGSFVVAWESLQQDGAGYGVFAQRFASDGTPAGTEFQVSAFTAHNQYHSSVGSDAAGNFVIVWDDLNARDGSSVGVFGQRFASDGTRTGTEFQVNSYTTFSQYFPSVDVDANGAFVVTWQSHQDGYLTGVFGQRFAPDGSRAGTEFQVNSYTSGREYQTAVAVVGPEGFVVSWTGGDIFLHGDGDLCGVFAKHLPIPSATPTNTVPATATATVTATPTATTTATLTLTPPPAGACPDTPDTCQVSAKGKLILKDNADNTKDKLVWKFGSGPALVQGDFGDPTTSDVYAFCVYDDGAKVMELTIPAGLPWETLSTKGYQYKDTGGANDGVTKVKLIGGAAGKSKLQLKGKGAGLGLPMPVSGTQLLSGTMNVVAQLRGNNTCWETSFTTADSKHRVNSYKGRF